MSLCIYIYIYIHIHTQTYIHTTIDHSVLSGKEYEVEVWSTVCTVQCAQYSVHSTVCTVHCAQYSVHSTLCTVHCAQYRVQMLDHRQTKKWTDRSCLHTRRSLHSVKNTRQRSERQAGRSDRDAFWCIIPRFASGTGGDLARWPLCRPSEYEVGKERISVTCKNHRVLKNYSCKGH